MQKGKKDLNCGVESNRNYSTSVFYFNLDDVACKSSVFGPPALPEGPMISVLSVCNTFSGLADYFFLIIAWT